MAGFSMLYEDTRLPEFRDAAVKVTARYLALLERQERQAAQRQAQAGAGAAAAASPAAAAAAAAAAAVGGDAKEEQRLDRWVPMWDFDAPYARDVDGPRDTSGGAVAALGMLHLARALQRDDAAASQLYLCAGLSTLRALATRKYLVDPAAEASQGLLKHATGGLPLKLDIDVGLITADYYFLTALAFCNSWGACREAAAGR
jgi:hypothetical protein